VALWQEEDLSWRARKIVQMNEQATDSPEV
jgi:hypothetical protein